MDHTGTSSTRLSLHARSSQGKESRGVSWHHPTATSPSKAISPGGGPSFTTWRKADLFFSRGCLRYALPIRQYMHQQPLQAPNSPNRSSSAGQTSGVRGRILSFIAYLTDTV